VEGRLKVVLTISENNIKMASGYYLVEGF